MIHCDAAGVDVISKHFETEPSDVVEFHTPAHSSGFTHCWVLDSPIGHDGGDPTTRLAALADIIEPFGKEFESLPLNVTSAIDIVYHVTPQHVGGITGEFDWFRCPAKLMSRISGWGLDVSYECFWFDHPDWQRLRNPWWRTLLERVVGPRGHN